MSRESFQFPVDPVGDRNPPRQIHGVTTLRTLMFFQNAISELQDRIEAIEAKLTPDGVASLLDEKVQEEIKEDA